MQVSRCTYEIKGMALHVLADKNMISGHGSRRAYIAVACIIEYIHNMCYHRLETFMKDTLLT